MDLQYRVKKVAETTVSTGDRLDALQVKVDICAIKMVIGDIADPCVQISNSIDLKKLMVFLENYEISSLDPLNQ